MLSHTITAAALLVIPGTLAYVTGVDPVHPPHQTEEGQYGYNDCYKYPDSRDAKCQTVHIESLDDFCLWAPPQYGTVGDTERYEVAWCTKARHGARLIPAGTITGAHVVHTSKYIQITGTLNQRNLNIPDGDSGGELDPSGADGKGNPIGGIVVGPGKDGKMIQFNRWTQFIGSNTYCIRACYPGGDDYKMCEHIYDTEGCEWNMPANYDSGTFESCQGDNDEPMGVYRQPDGSESTFHHGDAHTPGPHPAAPSSQCTRESTIPPASYPTGMSKVKRMV